jgi:ABC-type glycerol-3-phosphate transport system substrate-binding protein
MTIRTVLAALTGVAVLTLTAGCGGESDSPAADASSSGGADTTTIEVTIEGDDIVPAGERVQATAGEPVHIVVVSDREGELHVHSSPEQQLAYVAGTTELDVTIDKPGIVEIEDHVAEVLIVQLEVH